MNLDELRRAFSDRYGGVPRFFHAPGRVNLIGEHTDNNEGFVLPFAIDCGTTAAAASRLDRVVQVYSQSRSESASFNLDDAGGMLRGHWLDYVEGTARSLQHAGVALTGADLYIDSDIPLGAGLSSSAALEVAAGLALCGVSEQEVEPMTLVKAANRAEREYVGTQSGMMDQYVSVFGEANRCLLLDCRSLTSQSIPIPLQEFSIVVCDTGVKHALASSQYNRRREECMVGVALLRQHLPGIKALRDVSGSDLALWGRALPETILKRCRHVVSENERTLAAAQVLGSGDLYALGCLMFQSHESLREDYEVTSPELDLLVDTAQTCRGVLGSRMTGGGFGGCTITLMESAAVEEFVRTTRQMYWEEFEAEPSFLVPTPSSGAAEMKNAD